MTDTTRPITDVLVLLSGGQDSTTCLFWAKDAYPDARIHALTVFYGQRHDTEVYAAVHIAKVAGCASHRIVDLSGALGSSDSALLTRNSDATLRGDGGIPDAAMPQGLPTSFVPGRNLVFLAVAGAHAGAIGASVIVTGVCQTDYSGYPDCRRDFIDAMSGAINEAMPSSLRPIMVEAPLMRMTKAETVVLMVSFAHKEVAHRVKPVAWEDSIPWRALGHSVTCYHGKRPGCGTCPACALRVKGFSEAGVIDPGQVYPGQVA
jgi:7-cyano-7-deazaguanine synthase